MIKERLAELKASSSAFSVLFVEDDINAREATATLLKELFRDIVVAVDGLDGLEHFEHERFDLIISDIDMPKLNGIDMIKKIRETDQDIPILVLSAHSDTSFLLETIKAGIDGFLLKPLELDQFITTLVKVVKKLQLQRENEAYSTALEQKVQERTGQLIHQLYHDQLTSLKNQTALLSDLNKNPKGTLFLVDIDSFQSYNEYFGIAQGNEIIIAFAQYLERFTEELPYTLYRIYGDGFVLYTTNYADADQYQHDLEMLMNHLADFTINLEDYEETIEIDATIGIASNDTQPLEKAEMAMKYAKSANKSFMVFNPELNSADLLKSDIFWRKKIKNALLDAEGFIPVFQPIVDQNKRITKYEALMRLVQHDNGQRQLISPFHFLETAKKTKYYRQMTRIMVEKSFRVMQTHSCNFSINLSFEDIADDTFTPELERLINTYNVRHRLVLEIVETEYIKDYKIVKAFVKHFQSLGVRIAIDDFGSGYSNFSHIFELQPDFIKIDGSLIKDIPVNKELSVLVKAIVSFSKELGIRIIAEFVSSKEIFDILCELGIDEFQGYYFAEPSEQIGNEDDE